MTVKAALDAWFHEVDKADWATSADVKASYKTASIISADRVVFNIGGNHYRLIAGVNYRQKIVFIKWLGSHKEYDKIDARKIEYANQTDSQRRGPRGGAR
jgi:mRNA interferase HigB